MDDRDWRTLLRRRLPDAEYPGMLFYLMGPYKSFNLAYYLSEAELAEIEVEELPGPLRRLFANRDAVSEAEALLRRVQGELRTDPGVNAFLAVDADLPTAEVDALTQSEAFATASNATAFILPYLGHNFGVGEEAGAILEAASEELGERLVFVHEDAVTSQMLVAANRRWDLRIESYETEAELVDLLRRFAGEIMHRERRGDLDQL